MLKSKHFPTEQELLDWVNAGNVRCGDILSINYKAADGSWILFYCE